MSHFWPGNSLTLQRDLLTMWDDVFLLGINDVLIIFSFALLHKSTGHTVLSVTSFARFCA